MGKLWSEVKGVPDLYEERDLIKFLENSTPYNREKAFKAFGLSKDDLKFQTISKNKVKIPPFDDRFDLSIPEEDEDYEILKLFPLIVIFSRESNSYIIIKGKCHFIEAVAQGVKNFNCIIITSVKYDYEAYVERLSYVFSDPKPFHVLEKTMSILKAKEVVISKYGNLIFFKRGGDRRSKNYKKVSLVNLLKEQMPYRKSQIGILARLGDNIGPDGIEQLYNLLISEGKKLSLNLIHRMNPKMKKQGLRNQIKKLINKLDAEGKSEDEIDQAVALIIYDFIFKEKKESSVATKSKKDKDDKSDEKEVQIPRKPQPINKQDADELRKYYEICHKQSSKIRTYLNSKNEFTDKESEKIFEMNDKLNKTCTNYLKNFLKFYNGK